MCAPDESTCLFLSRIKELFHMKLLLVDRLVLFIQGHVEIEEVVVEDWGGQTCEWLH